jgi:hypothetical protein
MLDKFLASVFSRCIKLCHAKSEESEFPMYGLGAASDVDIREMLYSITCRPGTERR